MVWYKKHVSYPSHTKYCLWSIDAAYVCFHCGRRVENNVYTLRVSFSVYVFLCFWLRVRSVWDGMCSAQLSVKFSIISDRRRALGNQRSKSTRERRVCWTNNTRRTDVITDRQVFGVNFQRLRQRALSIQTVSTYKTHNTAYGNENDTRWGTRIPPERTLYEPQLLNPHNIDGSSFIFLLSSPTFFAFDLRPNIAYKHTGIRSVIPTPPTPDFL